MIVSELSPGAIGGAIKDLDLKRQADRRKAVELYQGIGLEEEVRKYFDPAALAQCSLDVQKVAARFVNKRYSVYQAAPDRIAITEDYAALQGNLDPVCVTVERLCGVLGTVAMLATVTEAEVMHYLPLVEFEPIHLPDDPEPYGVAYPLFHASTGTADKGDLTWIVWTDLLHFQCSGKGNVSAVVGPDGAVNDQLLNPYGVTPVVFVHREPSLTGEWWRPIDTALLTTQRSYNVLGVQGNLGAMFQALGQAVITGADKSEVQLGPSKTLFLPQQGATFEMVAPPGGLNQLEEWMRWKLDSLAASMGLAINWAGEMGATSGEHQRMKEIELTTSIMADFPLWAEVERERHRVARAIYLYHFKVDFGEDLSVNFTEPNIPQSEEQMRAEWEFEYSKGLASLQDYYRRKDASATDDQIAERIAKVQEERTAAPGPVAPQAGTARPGGGLAALLARPVDEEA